MDLGIRGRRAIVCASSKGLGLACARSLAREGVDLVMLARGHELAQIRQANSNLVRSVAQQIDGSIAEAEHIPSPRSSRVYRSTAATAAGWPVRRPAPART